MFIYKNITIWSFSTRVLLKDFKVRCVWCFKFNGQQGCERVHLYTNISLGGRKKYSDRTIQAANNLDVWRHCTDPEKRAMDSMASEWEDNNSLVCDALIGHARASFSLTLEDAPSLCSS
jgi:hypothetical protein